MSCLQDRNDSSCLNSTDARCRIRNDLSIALPGLEDAERKRIEDHVLAKTSRSMSMDPQKVEEVGNFTVFAWT